MSLNSHPVLPGKAQKLNIQFLIPLHRKSTYLTKFALKLGYCMSEGHYPTPNVVSCPTQHGDLTSVQATQAFHISLNVPAQCIACFGWGYCWSQ